MMDDYDMGHDCDYVDNFDIFSNYSDENIREIFDYDESFVDAVKDARYALKVLCPRRFTQVGVRVRNKSKSTNEVTKWTLVRVWRATSGQTSWRGKLVDSIVDEGVDELAIHYKTAEARTNAMKERKEVMRGKSST
jgi:hypothetical protein